MLKLTAYLYIIALFLYGGLAQAATANGIVDKIQTKYGELKAFEAKFKQTLTHKESGSTEKRQGQLLFQKPLQIRWQTAKPHEETLIVSSREIWDYIPEEETAFRYSPEIVSDSRNIIQVLTGQAKLTKDFEVKDLGKNGELVKLQLYPKEPNTQMVEAAIWVEPAQGYIRRVLVTDFYGNTNDVALETFTPKNGFPAREFQFTPPKGVEIEDHTKKDIQERELFK